ncbi:hypothetical protein LCGC14_0790720 [marine sediment metagenome]|uniref:DUF1273 domain-containing protein n=1 Tax=marine sediment metagenome TaxID=412755 RepID=A0A0F9SZP7_9ZZZZ
MYKIGIIGSGPERLDDRGKVRRSIGRLVDHLAIQYGEDSVVFSVEAKIGIGLWTAEECIDREYKYHLFLPYSLEDTCEHWYEDQQRMLKNQYDRMYSLTICNQKYTHKALIDSSNFIVVYWAGNKAEKVCKAIKYAFEHNKIVLDGFNDLRLMTNQDVRKNRKIWKKK